MVLGTLCDSRGVLCKARSWTQWSSWVPFNTGYSTTLWFYEFSPNFSGDGETEGSKVEGIADSHSRSWSDFFWIRGGLGMTTGKAVVDVSCQLKSPPYNFCLDTQLENGSQVLQDGDGCCGHLKMQTEYPKTHKDIFWKCPLYYIKCLFNLG